MGDQQQPEPDPQAEGQWTDGQILFLKRAIAVMSTVLVLGFALVVGRIIYLSGQPDPASAPAAATPAAMIVGTAEMPKLAAAAQLALPKNSVVRNLSLSGSHLAVHYSAPTGDGIAIIDLAKGTVASRIRLSTGSASK